MDDTGLVMLALMLGVKHGLDADHLATIDSLTRWAASHPSAKWSRRCGLLFSIGHGIVVVSTAVAVAAWAQTWTVPAWFERLGSSLSIALLTALGLLNLKQVFSTPSDQAVERRGLLHWMFAHNRGVRWGHPLWSLAIGALFALSFDTLSQASLFALSSAAHGGWPAAMGLALAFTAGMLLTDGLNGWLVSEVLQRSDRAGVIASRVLGLLVGVLSLSIAGLGVARQFAAELDEILADRAPWIGLGLTATIVLVALWLVPPRALSAWLARQPEKD